VPPDAVPPSRLGAPLSSRNAVRAGVLAALSSPAAPAAAQAPPEAAAVPARHPPARGFGASLRAAGRQGLLMARPLAMPFLHRLQARMRTAVNESDVAARVVGIERAVRGLQAGVESAAGASGEVSARLARVETSLGGLPSRGDVEAVRSSAVEAVRRSAQEGAAALDAARREIGSLQEGLAAARHELALVRAAQDHAALRADELARSAQRAVIPAGDEFLVRTPDGYLLVPAEDLPFLIFLSESGVPERGTRRVLERLLPPGGTFLDVGANVGTLTLFGARAVGPAGRVFAVEPTPRLAALLGRSLAMNGLSGRVSVVACAAGEASGEAVLHLSGIMSHNSLLPSDGADAGRTMTVPLRPVDEVVPPGTVVDVAKIDVEGAELRVWRGMRRVLEESPALAAVLELNLPQLPRMGVTLEAWLDEVEAPGFAAYAIDELTGTCRPARGAALGDMDFHNVLLLRPDAAARHPGLIAA
jgi:FkbM family methyltransferase